MGQVRREVLHEAVRAWLENGVGKQVGLDDPPADLSDPAYVILIPINSARGEGSFFDPEEDRDWVYQASSYGENRHTAFWLASNVTEVFIGRGSNGKYLHELVIPGINVQWRLSDNLGGSLPSGVGAHEVQDTFRIRTGA